jgi:CheY-like chemotaxis protein
VMLSGTTRAKGAAMTRSNPRMDQSADENSPDRDGEPRGSEHILFVEDDENVRDVVLEILSELGYHVVSARDGEEALERLAGDAPIDLLFTDHVLANGINGRELGRQATLLRPGIRVLLTSGYGSRARTEKFPVLAKPYRRLELATAIRSVLEGNLASP